MKELFYYLRDKNNHPICTVALMEADDGTISRGVAIRSEKEKEFSRKAGRRLASGRAKKAMYTKSNNYPTISREAIIRVIDTGEIDDKHYSFFIKSHFNPSLTSFEKELLARRGTDGTNKTEA
jgi:hypothetical protein